MVCKALLHTVRRTSSIVTKYMALKVFQKIIYCSVIYFVAEKKPVIFSFLSVGCVRLLGFVQIRVFCNWISVLVLLGKLFKVYSNAMHCQYGERPNSERLVEVSGWLALLSQLVHMSLRFRDLGHINLHDAFCKHKPVCGIISLVLSRWMDLRKPLIVGLFPQPVLLFSMWSWIPGCLYNLFVPLLTCITNFNNNSNVK